MRTFPIILLALIAAGCGSRGPVDRADPHAEVVIEDFEQDTSWSIDSAGNYAALSFSDRAHTSGAYGLNVAYTDNGRGKTILRKEIDWDCTQVERFALDVLSAGPAAGQSCSFGVHGEKGTIFETRAMALEPGWNHLVFTCDRGGFKPDVDWQKWLAERGHLNRVQIYLYPGGAKNGEAVIDNLRCAGDGKLLYQAPARILGLSAAPASLKRQQSLELTVDLAFPTDSLMRKLDRNDAWLRNMTAVQGRFLGPDGETVVVRGFCTGIAKTIDQGEQGWHYRLCFTPRLTGPWRYQIGVQNAGRWTWADPGAFTCLAETRGPGMIRLDRDDPRYFSYEAGGWYYPLGQNVAWTGDYAPYLTAIADYGGNYLRTWTCPWNNPLDVDGKLNVVNFAAAERIDRMFALAGERGVAIQLAIFYHGMLGDDWKKSPYNAANGGPCNDAREFWTNGEARMLCKRQLDYVVARWAHLPQLFAWELFNETDLCPSFNHKDIVAWHREMSAHLKAIDPYRHLVTTSLSGPSDLTALWRIEDIDFAQVHSYHPQVGQALDRAAIDLAGSRKPWFLGEFGRGWEAKTDQVDREGRHLHQMLWLAWCAGLAGNAMPWWWDTYIEPNHLQVHFAALSRFIKGEDLRGKRLRSVQLDQTDATEVCARALIADDAVYGYVYARAATEPGPLLGPLLAKDRALVFSGIAAGAWTLELWDAYTGTIIESRAVASDAAGTLRFAVPEMARDFAFKLKRQAVPLGLRLE